MATVYLVKEENPAAVSAVKKIASVDAKPGAVIFLSDEEFTAIMDGSVTPYTLPDYVRGDWEPGL